MTLVIIDRNNKMEILADKWNWTVKKQVCYVLFLYLAEGGLES